MSCRKAFEIDLAAYVADPTGAAWAEFRDHYPRCGACAAEVRAWTELHETLAAATHPSPDELLRWVDAPGALPPQARHAIAGHVASCAACRDEARTLRSFDPLAAPVAARPARRRLAFPSFGRIVWNPAFAYAVALVVGLYPLLAGRLAPERRDASEMTRLARGPKAHEDAARPAPPVAADVEGDRVARKELAEAPAAPAPATGGRARASGETGNELAKARPGAAPPPAERGGGAELEDEDAASTTGFARQAPTRDEAPEAAPVIVLRAGEDARAIAARDGEDVRLRVDGAAPGVASLRLTSERGHGLVVPWAPGGEDARVPAAWLRPGRYEIELLDAGAVVVATTVLRVGAP